MQLFKKLTVINFIGLRKLALIFSIALLAASTYSLSTQGLNYGIDFSGGTKLELAYQQDVSVLDMRATLASSGYPEAVVQHFGSNKDVLIRIPLSPENSDAKVSDDVVKILAASEVGPGAVRSVEFVGP
ncbi:MAG: preprotein translocase subunit SecF, partial [Arenicella sp.]